MRFAQFRKVSGGPVARWLVERYAGILLPYAFKHALPPPILMRWYWSSKYLAGLYHHLDGSHGVQSVALWSYTYDNGGIWRGGVILRSSTVSVTLMMRLIERKATAFERRN